MKYQPKANGMLVEEPFWDDVPVIQRQDEFPIEDFQTDDHLARSDDPPAAEAPPVPAPESNIAPAEEETDEAASPSGPKTQAERPDDAPTPIVLLDQPLEPSTEEPLPAQESRLTLVEVAQEEVLVENIQPEVLPFQQLPSAQQPKITQVEAMRQALADLGLGTRNADLANYLRDKFGILAKNIAVLKSTAKKSLFRNDANEEQPDLPEITEPQAEDVLSASQEEVTVVVESLPAVALDESLVDEEPQISPFNGRMAKNDTLYSMKDVKKVKGLCDRMGIERLLALIDVLE